MLLQVPVLHRGFIRTIKALNLTDGAIDLARAKEDQERLKRARESVKKSRHAQGELALFECRRRRHLQLEIDESNLRVRLYDDPFKLPRSMKGRRIVARKRAQKRRFLVLGMSKI